MDKAAKEVKNVTAVVHLCIVARAQFIEHLIYIFIRCNRNFDRA